MSPRSVRRAESLVLDPEVLRPGPVCEFGASLAVAAQGGTAVQPWRDLFLADERAGIACRSHARELPTASFSQAIVHLQKSRAATFDDLAEAWRILAPEGELVLTGPNTLGIVSAVKRLAEQLGQEGVVVANRARARAVRFRKGSGGPPTSERPEPFDVPLPGSAAGAAESTSLRIEPLPGVFSAKGLDPGSALLLEVFASIAREAPPRRIVDLGCGTGVLGLAAARLCPDAEVLLVDADARAVECAGRGIERHGLADRCRVLWWDAREAPPVGDFDLALVNPPFHLRGPEVDLGPALALFASLESWLARRGRALLVANRTLPYEAPLARLGELEQLADVRGYKLLSLVRSPRSSGRSGRSAPGARSGGRSRPPIRSR